MIYEYRMFHGLDLCCADPAQPLTVAGEELDDLDHDVELDYLDHDLERDDLDNDILELDDTR